jgi:hypothetical protein
MILNAHFFLLNDDFSQEHADAQHQGEESENNLKYEWEDELEVSEGLKKISLVRHGNLPLTGFLPNGDSFLSEVKDVFLIVLSLENGNEGFMGVSESILDSYEMDNLPDRTILKIYIKDYEPHGNPMPGVYIASKEFPKDLIQ